MTEGGQQDHEAVRKQATLHVVRGASIHLIISGYTSRGHELTDGVRRNEHQYRSGEAGHDFRQIWRIARNYVIKRSIGQSTQSSSRRSPRAGADTLASDCATQSSDSRPATLPSRQSA